MIEKKLIEQLAYGDSQWTYREDLKTEEDLWKNFKYILEQNNKDCLNGENLSDAEFEQVKNQLQFSAFYKAGEWLVGENGKVQVHVQHDTERLHLVVMNHEHIAGGGSVYEVSNQYSALKSEDEKATSGRDRRFDVTLMIPPDKPIFVGESKIYNSTVNDVLTRHCKACGISEISIHGLRHTHASLLLFAGVSIASVARRLGHASMTTTQKTYLHIIQELENKDVDLVMRTLSGL